jgi:formylglycine-generating enzyme required for sulfatase activity
LHAHLSRDLSDDLIFMDVEDGIPPGADFVRMLGQRVAQCDVVLAVIGKSWLTPRINDPADFVRVEIESAMRLGKFVIPVLVNKTEMPRAAHLPETMAPFVRRQAVRITTDRLRSDVKGLIQQIQRTLFEIDGARKAEQERACREAELETEKRRKADEADLRRKERELKEEKRRTLRWRIAIAGGVLSVGAITLLIRGALVTPGEPDIRSPSTQVTAANGPSPLPPSAKADAAMQATAPDRPSPSGAPLPRRTSALPSEPVPPIKIPLTAELERALKEDATFTECEKCPSMVVLNGGTFTIGSPKEETGRSQDEGPQLEVTVLRFAVGRDPVTFEVWDAYKCVTGGDCNKDAPGAERWADRANLPVVNVSWSQAQGYVKWLSKKTGKDYRLLFEVEYEYAARGRSPTAYPWGSDIGIGMANCTECGSPYQQLAPVGRFPPNGFGLRDIVGNVAQWTEDCYHQGYTDLPEESKVKGKAWTVGDCGRRVVRGGSWASEGRTVRSAFRGWSWSDNAKPTIGFRVARTLAQ